MRRGGSAGRRPAWAATDLRLADAIKRRDRKAVDVAAGAAAPTSTRRSPMARLHLPGRPIWTIASRPDLLLAAGANVKTADEYGETPLTLAAANGNAALVEKLLKAGADAECCPLGWRNGADDRRQRGQRRSGEAIDRARRRMSTRRNRARDRRR